MPNYVVDDKVRHKDGVGDTYKVQAMRLGYAWLMPVTGPPFTGNVEDYRKLETFFVPGKKYGRKVPFSIHAQANDAYEEFVCDTVKMNVNSEGTGRGPAPVAFGQLLVRNGAGKATLAHWILLYNYGWEHDGWKEVVA